MPAKPAAIADYTAIVLRQIALATTQRSPQASAGGLRFRQACRNRPARVLVSIAQAVRRLCLVR